MNEEQEIIQQGKKERIKKMLILIIITMLSILVIAGVVILVIELTRKKDENKDSKEQSEEKDTNPTSIINTDEQIADYDQQLLNFGGKEANSFSPRAEPKSELRSDGVYYRTEVNFGSEYPNSYLDIYYPGAVEEDRPTYIYWHGGGHIFGDKNLGDPLSPNSDASMHMLTIFINRDLILLVLIIVLLLHIDIQLKFFNMIKF